MTIEGGCLCKSVRYRITAEPLTMRLCWCRDCQYLAAGSATANVVFPSEAVTITGALSDFISVADSGNVMHRKFCPECGTPMTQPVAAMCPKCGADTHGAKFCPNCGNKMEEAPTNCPNCGAETKGAKFCPECGTKLG